MNALMILVQGAGGGGGGEGGEGGGREVGGGGGERGGGVMSQGCRGLRAVFVVINGNVYSLSKLELNQTLEFLLFSFSSYLLLICI